MFHSKCERNLDMLNAEVKRLGEQADAYKNLLNDTLDLLRTYYFEIKKPNHEGFVFHGTNRESICYVVRNEIEQIQTANKRATEDARIEGVVKDVLLKNKAEDVLLKNKAEDVLSKNKTVKEKK